jgi:hypothetical protein
MRILPIIVIFVASIASANCAIVYFYSDHYRGKIDSPFLPYLQNGTTYVENFENQGSQRPRNLLTTPNATGWNGIAAGSSRWGVQEDYSDEDLSGRTWDNNGSSPDSTKLPAGIHFDFTPDDLGNLPEYVGAALLGRRDPSGSGLLNNFIFVYDRDGNELTQGEWKFIRPPDVPTAVEDLFLNFYGIYVPGGISSIHFRDFVEVDHLTYGYSIPEPSAALLATAAGLLCLRRKRK